ncbi:MAG: hypothetical protein QM820_23475 [Minicystis sp.]
MRVIKVLVPLLVMGTIAFSCGGGTGASGTGGGVPANACCLPNSESYYCPDEESAAECRKTGRLGTCGQDQSHVPDCSNYCAAPGGYCAQDTDCCSGTCYVDICEDKPTVCGAPGDPCTTELDCCNETSCVQGVCEDPDTGPCHEEGSICLDGIPCCPGQGVCLGGSCQKSNNGNCMDGGATCNYGGQCCTGLCKAHKCTTDNGSCGGLYAVCAKGSDCCSGFCVQQECQPGTGTCIDEVEPCDFDSQCCTGSCQTNVCL